MISLLRRLLDPAYLYAIDPGPLGPWRWLYLAWAAALLAGAVGAWWRGRKHASSWERHALVDPLEGAAWHARLEPGAPRVGAPGEAAPRGAPRAWYVAAWAFGTGFVALLLRIVAPLAGFLPPYARYLALEVWTARVWPVSATIAGLLALGVGIAAKAAATNGGMPWRALVRRQVDALAGRLSPDDPALPLWAQALLAAVHLAGLGALWLLGGHAAWWAVPSLVALALLPLAVRPRRPRLETLVPLLPAYLGAAATLLLERRLGIDVSAYQAYRFPDPWSPWFDVPALVVAGAAYVLWIQLRLLGCRWQAGIRERLVPALVGLLLVAWFVATVLVHRTHGVTASDPYSYVQMAIDLAETGSPLHAFPLAGTARDLGLPTWPAVHVGYHPPVSGVLSPTMWPIGWPLLMAPFYLLGGLDALYFVAPLMQALSLLVAWLAANEVLRGRPRAERWAVGLLTCLLVATSPEGAERMLVPMADAAAQLFTTLTMWLLLRAVRSQAGAWRSDHLGAPGSSLAGSLAGSLAEGSLAGSLAEGSLAGSLALGAAAGIAFGMAYLIRHPQLPLGVAALAAAWLVAGGGIAAKAVTTNGEEPGGGTAARAVTTNERMPGRSLALPGRTLPGWTLPGRTLPGRALPGWRRAAALLVAFGGAALLVALPDLIYHRTVFGGWLRTESTEWFLISGRNVTRSAFSLLEQGVLRREELGYLVPFLALGAWQLWRRQRAATAVLGSATVAVLGFHLFYEALRPRDLIPLLPVAYLCVAVGLWGAWRWARQQRTLLAALCLVGSAVLLGTRSWETLAAPWRDDVITFGHVSAPQRAAFEQLRALTPEDAVIGSMLNGGAIELYARRGAVHPAPWSEDELGVWVDALLSEGRACYVLDDGEEMGPVLQRLEGRYRLRQVTTLDLPYFALGGGNLPRTAVLYQVEGRATTSGGPPS